MGKDLEKPPAVDQNIVARDLDSSRDIEVKGPSVGGWEQRMKRGSVEKLRLVGVN